MHDGINKHLILAQQIVDKQLIMLAGNPGREVNQIMKALLVSTTFSKRFFISFPEIDF